MWLKKKTMEELLALEQELQFSMLDDESDMSLAISVLEEIYRRMVQDEEKASEADLINYKKRLITSLSFYGVHLQNENRPDMLRRALRFERENPLVHFLLGQQAYQSKSYFEGIIHFQNAITFQQTVHEKPYKLTKTQHQFAHLYLSNSACLLAEKAQNNADKILETTGSHDAALTDIIRRNEIFLQKNQYSFISELSFRQGDKEECRLHLAAEDTIILFVESGSSQIIFNGNKKEISLIQAEVFQYLCQHSSRKAAASSKDLEFIFLAEGEGAVQAMQQSMDSLKSRLLEIGLKEGLFVTVSGRTGPSYYYNQAVPFLIIHKSEESFLLRK
ncbi:hypothetical protein [Alteribacillus sp. HJP-4]|uniref:hypothetical protein n=1 Tax=Alteribacillus sp. HJP-4 TaxID=2775394 RepID=UPI0035CCCBA4